MITKFGVLTFVADGSTMINTQVIKGVYVNGGVTNVIDNSSHVITVPCDFDELSKDVAELTGMVKIGRSFWHAANLSVAFPNGDGFDVHVGEMIVTFDGE